MNNYRLTTSLNEHKSDSSYKDLFGNYLILPPIYLSNKHGQIINIKTSEVVRDNYVLEVIKMDQSVVYFSTIYEAAISLNISRPTIYESLENGKDLSKKGLIKLRKVRVYQKITKS